MKAEIQKLLLIFFRSPGKRHFKSAQGFPLATVVQGTLHGVGAPTPHDLQACYLALSSMQRFPTNA